MSIFDRIKGAIFGRARTTPATTSGPATSAGASPGARGTGATATGAAGGTGTTSATRTTAAVSPPHAEPVDIETVMQGYEKESQQKLNWRTSIVDLLKLLDIDSSLENRKALAQELGYTGSTTDSASMNIWLHRQVMKKLQENGGKVPASLVD